MTKSERTKQTIFDSALQLFRDKGYENVSVDEIVEKAGVAKGTFYIYFSSKSQIPEYLYEVYDDRLMSIYDAIDKSLREDRALIAFIADTVNYLSTDIGLNLMKMSYREHLAWRPIHKGKDRALYVVVKDIISRGVEHGVFTSELSVDELTTFVIRSLHGNIFDWCVENGGFDLQRETTRYFENLIRAL